MVDIFRKLAVAAVMVAAPAWALAADFDGSKALICATVETHDCSAGTACTRGLPQDVGAPQFMRIDFEKKTIAGPYRTTPIVALNRTERQTLLQGSELGFGWTLAIDRQDGSVAASYVGDIGVVAIFGACTPL